MIGAIDLQTLASFFVERMLNATVEGIGIVLFAWLLLRLVGKQNSGTRFAVWLSTLAAIAALPLVDRLDASHVGLASQAQFSLSSSWALYLFGAWIFFAAIGLARVGAGLRHLLRLKKNCSPLVAGDLDPLLQSTLGEFGKERPVTLCVSDSVRMPTAIGYFKPLVVIPAWAMKELSTAELNSILLHELAHLRRWDDCTNLAQKILEALFFFHPAVWWIEGRLALEREMACDDLVLARTDSPKAYAACLISLAEKGFLRRGLALAQAAVSRVHHTSLRVTQILDRNRPRATRVWTPALALLGGFAIAVALAEPHLPRLVSVADPEPTAEALQTVSSDGADFYRPSAVPAKLITTPAAEPLHTSPTPNSAVKHSQEPTPATQPRIQPSLPLLTETRGTQEIVAPATVFVMMRTEQTEGPGSAVWTFCVWRVTWIAPEHKKPSAEAVAKAI